MKICPSFTALAAITTALSLGACSAPDGGRAGGAVGQANGQTAAMAATFRYLFANNGSALKADAASYCVGIGIRPKLADPDRQLASALADVTPRIEPASACRIQERVLNANGAPSLAFNVEPLGCRSVDDCRFGGGYYEGNLSASSGTYRARRVGEVWQVTPEGPQAIS